MQKISEHTKEVLRFIYKYLGVKFNIRECDEYDNDNESDNEEEKLKMKKLEKKVMKKIKKQIIIKNLIKMTNLLFISNICFLVFELDLKMWRELNYKI